MAFPVVETTNTSQESSAVTTHTVSLPSGIVSGNLLLLFIDTNTATTVTGPSGWTELWAQSSGPYLRRGYYRQADGTEGTTVTFSTSVASQSVHISYRISGAENPSTQVPEAAVLGAGGSGTTIDPPSLTPTGGAKDYLWIAGASHNSASSGAVNAAPTNYSSLLTSTVATLVGNGTAQRNLNAASENPDTVGISASVGRRLGFTVAVHPAAGNDINVALTGMSATTAIGTLSVAVAIALSGIFSTVSAGNVTATQILSGISSAISVGSLTPDRSIVLTGISSTASVGIVAPNREIGLSGVAATATVGTVVADRAITPTGISATGATGTIVADRTIPLAGIFATGEVGTVTASQGNDLNLALTGIAQTGTVGTLVPDRTVALTGLSATGVVGTISVNTALGLTGLSNAGAVGTIAINTALNLTGLSAAGATGTIIANRAGALTGIAATGAVGTVGYSAGGITINVDYIITLEWFAPFVLADAIKLYGPRIEAAGVLEELEVLVN